MTTTLNDTIRAVFLAHGFTIKDGQTDLKPYVYNAVHALLSKLRATVADERAALSQYDYQALFDAVGKAVKVHPNLAIEISVQAFRAALASAPASEDGLTAKQAWWAGYRAGKGLPPDTPRQDAVKVDISSARLVTHWPNGTPRDERDTASDPEGKLIHDPTEPLLAASAPVAGEAQPVIHQHGFAADNQRLRTINESLDKQLEEVMTERDEYHDMADKLANAIADHLLVEIGEHSSSNCPWMRALDAIQDAAPQASECECSRKSKAVADSEAEL